MERQTLEQIIKSKRLWRTDKSTVHSYIPHLYDQFLDPLRDEEINILEIGTREGDSIRLWDDFFTKANIYGMDNNNAKLYEEVVSEKVTMHLGNAYSQEMADKVPDMDVIIDDGPHSLASQLLCIEFYFNKLKEGGIIIIEDIQKFEYIDQLEKKYIECGGTKEFEYYDLRHIKRRYDDLVAVLKK